MAEKASDEGEGAGGRQRRPHDSAYKYLFSSRRVVHQFLNRESNVIYTIRTGAREVYLYILIEFQSTVDKAIPVPLYKRIYIVYPLAGGG